ncbi:MAG TPA: DUF4390 domain-containing protein [Vicinamibacterales bacterium]|nr:DUF4390 domain-containing protein [Vicinamibacterales bacterium]
MRHVSAQMRLCGLALLAVMCLSSGDRLHAQAGQALRVTPIVHPDQVLISFELTDGLTDDVRQAILSGLKTTFTYTVELRLDVPIWVDRTIATATVTSSVEYYNLEREHHLVRMLDGRTEDAKVTADEAVVRKWMTSFDRLPLFRTSLLEANREYYVRVSATARPSNGSILWPFGSGTSAQAKFTFVR